MSDEWTGTIQELKAAIEANPPVAPASDLTDEALTLAQASYDENMTKHTEVLTAIQAKIDEQVE
jgi:hypothetical protein